ncbi:MAG: universal stress protein [Gammaproteobacteria bacterium]|nr:universal stress protein [Gammaproteobacteria bacterium]
MARYNKILLALDFHGDNAEIVEKGKEIADANGAELYLIHVNEPLAIAYAADGMSWSDQVVSLEASLRQEAQKKIGEIAKELGVPSDNCILREGRPSSEIHKAVEEHDIDLIVMGTHGQSGLQLLLGSTANRCLARRRLRRVGHPCLR